MRIAWICFYPASDFRSRPSLRQCRDAFHPVPAVTGQARLLAGMPDVELHIVTAARDYSADDHFVHDGIHFHFLRMPRVPRALLLYQWDRRRIHRCLQEIAPQLVVGFGTEGSFAYAAVTSPYPAAVRMQGIMARIVPAAGFRSLLQNPGWVVPLLFEHVSVRRGRRFICDTRFAADFVRQLNPTAGVYMVKTPVRSEFFAVARSPAPAAQPELLFVSSVVPAKGIEVLLTAFSAVVAQFPGAVLTVAGACDQRYMAVLKRLVTRLQLDGSVTFYGFQTAADVARLMARASLLVLPTLMDTSPNVILEAQIVGVPVITTGVGGVPELVEHGRTGILVPPGSPEELSAAILESLRNPKAAQALADAAQSRALAERRPETQAAKLIDVYRTISREARSS